MLKKLSQMNKALKSGQQKFKVEEKTEQSVQTEDEVIYAEADEQNIDVTIDSDQTEEESGFN